MSNSYPKQDRNPKPAPLITMVVDQFQAAAGICVAASFSFGYVAKGWF